MITIILAKATMVMCVAIVGLTLTGAIMKWGEMQLPLWLTLSLGVMILVSPLMAAATIISYIIEFL